MIFIVEIGRQLIKIFLINNVLEFRIIYHFFWIIIKTIKITFLIWICLNDVRFFLKKVTEINRINNSLFITLRTYKFGVT